APARPRRHERRARDHDHLALAGQASPHGARGGRRRLLHQAVQRRRPAAGDPPARGGMMAATLTGDFVLLRAGGLRLLVPQADVAQAEYLEAGRGDRRYVALSESMTL